MSERERAEEALRQSEQRYRQLFEHSKDPILLTNEEGRIIDANPAALELLGYSAEELISMNMVAIYADPGARQRLVDELRAKGFAKDLETTCLTKKGAILECLCSVTFRVNEYGKTIGYQGIIRDITERKRLEAQLLHSQKMEAIGTLAGGVAHDFNNMLTVILGYTELLKLRLPNEDPLLDSVEGIENAALCSKEITNQLLAFSRKQIIAPRPLNLNDSIRGIKETLSRLIGEHIDLSCIPGEKLWKVNVDGAQVDQVLVNLVVNARDAMPHGGTLVIETANVELDKDSCRKHAAAQPGDYVLLRVTDDGVGMDEKTLSHVFEPFFTTKPIGKGTGLGLATVYGIIQQNNGCIEVASQPYEGTTVDVYLPRIIEESRAEETLKKSPKSYKSGTILLVEDDTMVRNTTRELLQAAGYKVIAPTTAMEALALFETTSDSIDLVVIDVVMPGLSGKEVKERFDTIKPGTNTLFMSGYPADVIAQHGVLESGVHFIQKPFRIDELREKIRETMGKR